jgi:alginate O-acetyltransferase complex protein AlgI
MIFASFIFLFWFLPLFLGVYFALPVRARNLWLTALSFVFYGWVQPLYVGLMVLSSGFDFMAGLLMGPVDSGRNRKLWLVLALCGNLGMLAWFKYANLFVGTWNDLGILPVEWVKVVLPVGISFFTFQSMSYSIDVYRGEVKPTRSYLDFVCYVSMFPQLVAGPIVRYSEVAEQLRSRSVDLVKLTDGLFLFMIGFVKKVLVADQVGPLVDTAFGLEQPGLLQAWTGVLAYAVQIYFDFSGYSDMAIGLGLMLGFHFPLNFLAPYRARSITDFWRRWHVSLSTWLRDYLYIPLGGNRRGPGRTYVNLLTTMLLGGLWHGAQWTFLLWGGFHGVLLALERRFGGAPGWQRVPMGLRVLATFVLVLFGWAIFKADNLGTLGAIWGGMAGLHGIGEPLQLRFGTGLACSMLAIGLAVVFLVPRSDQLVMRFRPFVMTGAGVAFVLAVCHLLATNYSPFLYWRF